MSRSTGRQLLQLPGPTNVPDRVLQALAQPVIDHRGEEFAELAIEVLAGLRDVAGTKSPIALLPASGTGAWEASLANAFAAGDTVLLCDNGFFAGRWGDLAETLGLEVRRLAGDWRVAPDPDQVSAALSADLGAEIAGVLVVHNETSTGIVAHVAGMRAAIDAAGHRALLVVDTISSLGSIDYRHDEWGVDVTVGASQKGLMLPPGLSFNAVGPRALEARRASVRRVGYFDWEPSLGANETGSFPFTPATSLLFGLQAALCLLREEGLETVFRRHRRHAEATRAAVEGWGLETVCIDLGTASPTLTGVVVPGEQRADEVRRIALAEYDVALGTGLGKIAGDVFRIGHLGDLSDTMLCGALCAVELSLGRSGIPFSAGGVQAALELLAEPLAAPVV